ncbi:sarcosine dehydrogenase, mitochondrial-like [Sitodiplosis mosellana]|uniref:sarcosine dehydrogenase, mitochondrial-like n=1 Tax=Sitodiplosis mosellana TaxID=263140 RepID=UPI00244387D6|nr:sarcosine dehydrogenase, mitochondrial-like [Sitodiplosis mosellana]
MNRIIQQKFTVKNFYKALTKSYSVTEKVTKKTIQLPQQADVVIIGGGSAGCHTLYHLAKRGVKAVLLERCKLTAGTTWHTAGLLWRIRPSDVDIQLLNRSRDMLIDIKENTEFDPGWQQKGGLFIAHEKIRIDEYKRLSTIGKLMGIENAMLSSVEAQQIFPLLNPKSFIAALYSPGDGDIDPTLLCTALTKLAVQTSNAQVIEDCPVKEIITEQRDRGVNKIIGLRTDHGDIKTNCVVNTTGVWANDLLEPLGIALPLIPMMHSYIVSDPIEGIRGMPNVRDHDASIYFRIQGSSICMGGYERNPVILDSVAKDFNFGLYDLDWSTFESHVKGSEELCPVFATTGIKSTICGPESFTLDHKPIMGPDPRLIGLFHSSGYSSAGMMFGGGCGEQLAEWIIHGRPEFHMYNYDIRRFVPKQMEDTKFAKERSHEAYGDNYAMVFAHMQPLAGRNFKTDPLHEELVLNGAVMEEKQGYERPAFFYKEKAPINIPPYDWFGAYDHPVNSDKTYMRILKGDQKYDFSDHHERIGAEAMSCRIKAAAFNLSSFYKILIEGPEAKVAMEWICTNDINKPPNSIVYTCTLNGRGGVEANFMVTVLESGDGSLSNPKFNGNEYYIVGDGAYASHTLAHINETIDERRFNVTVRDLTDEMGIISIQGPFSRAIIEELTALKLSQETLPYHKSMVVQFKDKNLRESFAIRILRSGVVGELGYEIHVENKYCASVYNKIMNVGSEYGLRDAGFRAFYSLSCEKGTHRWGYDLRSDDTPVEANLESICRESGAYKGRNVVEKQQNEGIHKRLVYLTLSEEVPLWGLEGVYRNSEAVGHLRWAEYGYMTNKSIGKSYIHRSDGQPIDTEYLKQGTYEIDVLGKLYPAKLHLSSPFDKTNQRILGYYNEIPDNL